MACYDGLVYNGCDEYEVGDKVYGKALDQVILH